MILNITCIDCRFLLDLLGRYLNSQQLQKNNLHIAGYFIKFGPFNLDKGKNKNDRSILGAEWELLSKHKGKIKFSQLYFGHLLDISGEQRDCF